MNLPGLRNLLITNTALKAPGTESLSRESFIRALSQDSPESKRYQEAVSESSRNKENFMNVLAATMYTAGKIATKVSDRRGKLIGTMGMVAGKGIQKGSK